MALGSHELYELFLALAPARLSSARRALGLGDDRARASELAGALIPLAVDAALLGAEGVGALATALANAHAVERGELEFALAELERAVLALGHGDASGARVDEAALSALAERLKSGTPDAAALPTWGDEEWGDEERGPETRASGTPLAALPAEPLVADRGDAELSGVEHWQPQLAEDMVAAFLDECAERTEGLSARLLELEERGADAELVSEIFRDLHTLKGSSGFAGLKKLNRLAHVAEDCLGELRSGERAPDRALIDVLLEMLDAVRLILEQARAGAPIDVDVSHLVARLRDPQRGRAAAPPVMEKLLSEAPRPQAVPQAAPQATLRIDFEKVDLLLNLVGEIVLSRGQLAAGQEAYAQVLREVSLFRNRLTAALEPAQGRSEELVEDLQRIERVLAEGYTELEADLSRLGLAVSQLRDTVMKLRMVPIARLFTKYQRTVRELSHQLGKQVQVKLSGAETELDKVLVERLEDPLLHLVRNAVDHGIEPPERRRAAGKPEQGLLELRAAQRGGQIVVVVKDDGGGLDASKLVRKALERGLLTQEAAKELSEEQAFELIFQPGFSTADQVSDVSGRGVGMDVVRSALEKLKGGVVVRSRLGAGTEFELRLPLTLAITQVLAVRVSSELLALPLDAVVSAQTLIAADLEAVAASACLRIGEALIPVVDLGATLGLAPHLELAEAEGAVSVVQVGSERLGFIVQQVLGRHEVVIKSLGPLLVKTPCAAGATLIGDRIALVVDVAGVAARVSQPSLAAAAPAVLPAVLPRAEPHDLGSILIAEDSDAVRGTLQRELRRAGFRVTAAADGLEALRLAKEQLFDAICTDIMMPQLDGYQLIRALRELPQYRSVPIVVLSSKDARIDSLRGLDAGANAYLSKPADTAQLIRDLEALLAQRPK